MIRRETAFIAGKPVGVIRQDSNTGQIDFSPTKLPSKLLPRDWRSVDQLRDAVNAAYKDTGKDHE